MGILGNLGHIILAGGILPGKPNNFFTDNFKLLAE
jgi:hypothetical protein